MVQFDFSGKWKLLVQIEQWGDPVRQWWSFIQRYPTEIDGNFLLFTIDKPKVVGRVNGDRLNICMMLPILSSKMCWIKNVRNVIYFEAGIHETDDSAGKCFVSSYTTVYEKVVAVLKGCLTCGRVENVKILGHGLLLNATGDISVTTPGGTD
jgi:hypothetical protein